MNNSSAQLSIQSTVCIRLEDKTERVIHSIRSFVDKASLDAAFGIGKIIIDEFYDGSTKCWRKRGAKDMSLRRLAQHKDLPISASSLYRSIAIYELFTRLGGQTRWSRLGATHVRAVLALPEEDQIEMLDKAQELSWSTRRLENEAKKRRANDNRLGRPCLPPLVKAVRVIQASIQKSEPAFGDPKNLAELDEGSAQMLRDELIALRQKIRSYEDRLSVIPSDDVHPLAPCPEALQHQNGARPN